MSPAKIALFVPHRGATKEMTIIYGTHDTNVPHSTY